MYKIRQLGNGWQVYTSVSTNIGDIKLPIVLFYVHEYDSEQVKQDAQNYCDALNERDKIIMDLLKGKVK